MGEYEPITKGLREYIERHPTMMHAVGLTDLCDNIDAIHVGLERENKEMFDFCDRLKESAELREDVTLYGVDYIPELLDEDNQSIHVGDELTDDSGLFKSEGVVKALMLDDRGWSVNFEDGWCLARLHKWHHAAHDTFERIIADAIQAGRADVTVDVMPLIKRCKALCERTREAGA